VRKNFWSKMKHTVGKIPFALDVVAMYYCAIDPKTPLIGKITAFAALAYFISPLDAIPDMIPGAGFADDAAAIATALATLDAIITDEHKQQALEWANGRAA
jgi:uncharacterized membrane protein YkvA (DUF1232 family)